MKVTKDFLKKLIMEEITNISEPKKPLFDANEDRSINTNKLLGYLIGTNSAITVDARQALKNLSEFKSSGEKTALTLLEDNLTRIIKESVKSQENIDVFNALFNTKK